MGLVSSPCAPKTGAKLTEARTLALLPHWCMNIDMYGQEWTIKCIEKLKILYLWIFRPIRIICGQISPIFIEFNFHSLEYGQIDSNPVYGEFDNRHFEFHQYTNCVQNHNLKHLITVSVFINMNYLIMMRKVGNKNCIKAIDVKLITFLIGWRDDHNILLSVLITGGQFVVSAVVGHKVWHGRAGVLRHERMRSCLTEA